MDIPSKWTRGVENEKEFKSKIIEQRQLFERLYDIIDELETSNYKDSLKKGHYDKVAWPEYQADAIGYSRALSEIKLLLKFSKENK